MLPLPFFSFLQEFHLCLVMVLNILFRSSNLHFGHVWKSFINIIFICKWCFGCTCAFIIYIRFWFTLYILYFVCKCSYSSSELLEPTSPSILVCILIFFICGCNFRVIRLKPLEITSHSTDYIPMTQHTSAAIWKKKNNTHEVSGKNIATTSSSVHTSYEKKKQPLKNATIYEQSSL